MNYKKDLESLHDPASDLPNLLHLNHALNISKTQSDVSCLFKNNLKNKSSKECVMYSHGWKHFYSHNIVENGVATVVDEGCSEANQVFMRTYFSY